MSHLFKNRTSSTFASSLFEHTAFQSNTLSSYDMQAKASAADGTAWRESHQAVHRPILNQNLIKPRYRRHEDDGVHWSKCNHWVHHASKVG